MLFELTHLKSLSFFKCFSLNQQPAITIPSTGWDKFATTLETLEFRSNQGLTGPIPTSLGMVKSLKSLVIVGNGLLGEVPFEIGHLVNLRRLVISGNRLTGSIPTSIGDTFFFVSFRLFGTVRLLSRTCIICRIIMT